MAKRRQVVEQRRSSVGRRRDRTDLGQERAIHLGQANNASDPVKGADFGDEPRR